MSGYVPVPPEQCPTPVYHQTHRYCPSCTWTEPESVPVTLTRRHPLDVPAAAAYGAYRISAGGRDLPPWDALPESTRADWRAVADAVRMITEITGGTEGGDQ